MKYCYECGTKLIYKELEHEGLISFCTSCNQFRFPIYSTAVSMIVMNSDMSKILLIKQYNKDRFILVAGYINKGESAEDACIRELKEETSLDAIKLIFNKTEYFEKSNTLMINFGVIVGDEFVIKNYEIDSYEWFDIDDARINIAKNSLASKFLDNFYQNHLKK